MSPTGNVNCRLIISEITTDQIVGIAVEYRNLMKAVRSVIYRLENKQIEHCVGMKVEMPDDNHHAQLTNELINDAVSEKRGNPILAENFAVSSLGIYRFQKNQKSEEMIRAFVEAVANIKNAV